MKPSKHSDEESSQPASLVGRVLATLSEPKPLDQQLAALQKQAGATSEVRVVTAFLAALSGKQAEAEAELALARDHATEGQLPEIELACVPTLLELGYPSRIAGALERAQKSQDDSDQLSQALSVLFQVQLQAPGRPATTGWNSVTTALALLSEGRAPQLAGYAKLIAAEAAFAAGALDRARRVIPLDAPHDSLLEARAALLDLRLGILQKGEPELLRKGLTKVIASLEKLGAHRDLGRAFLAGADLAALDRVESPATWLARAKPLLAAAGNPLDLRDLHQAFRRHGRRDVDRNVDQDIARSIDGLREQRDQLRDVLGALRDARDPQPGARQARAHTDDLVDGILQSVRESEEWLIGALRQTVMDRERLGQLVAICQQLTGCETLESALAAVPKLALTLCQADAAELFAVEENGTVTGLSAAGFSVSLPRNQIATEGGRAIANREIQLLLGSAEAPDRINRTDKAFARAAIAPLDVKGRPLLLVLECLLNRPGLDERGVAHLTVFASVAAATLHRARANINLQMAAARDTATLAAIPDGVLSLDSNLKVLALNRAAETLLDVRGQRLAGQKLGDILRLRPLAEALKAGVAAAERSVTLPHGELLVRAQGYEGGTIVIVRELASARRSAQKLVGSPARFAFDNLVGRDSAFLSCLADARRASAVDVPVLITGESGTGKEMLAQAIHNASAQASHPFVGVNVAAIPRELLESELFGYEKGAFTDARSTGKAGKFELAERGTILLDEIGDMPLDMQAKLLRVLQERALQRLGGEREVPIHARVIATTHRDLEQAVKDGTFRLDLFHRLRVVQLRLPPLRERRADIPLLIEHQLARFAERNGRKPVRVASEVMAELQDYEWPGNVRELANLLEGEASLLPPDETEIRRIPSALTRARERGREPATTSVSLGGPKSMAELERLAIEEAMKRCKGNVAQAAADLGFSRATLYNKLKQYGIQTSPKTRQTKRAIK